jgi:hypothetical protein
MMFWLGVALALALIAYLTFVFVIPVCGRAIRWQLIKDQRLRSSRLHHDRDGGPDADGRRWSEEVEE